MVPFRWHGSELSFYANVCRICLIFGFAQQYKLVKPSTGDLGPLPVAQLAFPPRNLTFGWVGHNLTFKSPWGANFSTNPPTISRPNDTHLQHPDSNAFGV